MIFGDYCHTLFLLCTPCITNASTDSPGTHTVCFQSRKSATAVPCGPAVTSPRPTMNERNNDSNFLLLFADVDVTPTLLEGLTDVDVLHMALGCRFALDIFTNSQQHSPTPDHEPLPHDPELSSF